MWQPQRDLTSWYRYIFRSSASGLSACLTWNFMHEPQGVWVCLCVSLTTKCVQCLTMRKLPPSARGAGGVAGSWTAWGPPAGLSRHNLAVHGTQQQHQTHGSKHLAGSRPRDLEVQQHRCHWGEQNILQQQTKQSLRGDIITEFMLTNEVSSVLLRCDG